MEQYSHEIVGVPDSIQDNKGAVLKIAEALNVQVKAKDINICHRVKRKRSNNIIVRFVSHKVKSALYKQRVKLKHVHFADIFTDATAADRVQANKIFINENSTAFHRELVGKANARKEELSLLGVWTINLQSVCKDIPRRKTCLNLFRT